jgi:hypothetical protein
MSGGHDEWCTFLPSEQLKQLLLENNFTIEVYRRHIREWIFKDVYELIEFHMTHYMGQFSHEHFNADVMKNHYGDGEIVITMPYMTVVAIKRMSSSHLS